MYSRAHALPSVRAPPPRAASLGWCLAGQYSEYGRVTDAFRSQRPFTVEPPVEDGPEAEPRADPEMAPAGAASTRRAVR